MCRLLAHVARRPMTVAEAIGEADLRAFADLSPRHPDGWGMAWWADEAALAGDGPPQRTRAVGGAREDPAFRVATAEVPAHVAVVHLRGATPGLTFELENCHPFVCDRAAFAQNGALYPQERLPELLPPELEATVEGSTDSERLFRLLHARSLEGGRPFPQVVRDTLAEVLQTYTSPVLNAMYLAPDALYVINAHNPTSVPYAGDPADMFAIRYRITDECVIVASSGFDQPESRGWWTLDNMTVLTVRFADRRLSIDRLDGVPVPAYTYQEAS
jgi:predicted glutamine amidotransferase